MLDGCLYRCLVSHRAVADVAGNPLCKVGFRSAFDLYVVFSAMDCWNRLAGWYAKTILTISGSKVLISEILVQVSIRHPC